MPALFFHLLVPAATVPLQTLTIQFLKWDRPESSNVWNGKALWHGLALGPGTCVIVVRLCAFMFRRVPVPGRRTNYTSGFRRRTDAVWDLGSDRDDE